MYIISNMLVSIIEIYVVLNDANKKNYAFTHILKIIILCIFSFHKIL